MKRLYTAVIEDHFRRNRQMLFLMGPRQVGKTTTSLAVKEDFGNGAYFNWDRLSDRTKILKGSDYIAEECGLNQISDEPPVVIFDEIHKYSEWKIFLKGLYDAYPSKARIIVTGSARLDVFKKGGDSLMGRYFYYRFHPLTVAEIIDPNAISSSELHLQPKEIAEDTFLALMHFGGFPDPFLKNDPRFFNRWKSLRLQQLFQEDIRDLTRVQEISQIEVLAELIRYQIGQLTSYESLAKKVRVSSPTIRNWIEVLKSFYYCFEVRPYSDNITRSLLKEPKFYLWDWSLCEDEGSRFENFVASHLHKAIHFWTDSGLGNYQLNFIRDKDKREVDFIILKDNKPWILIEVKSSDHKRISPSLHIFQEMTKAPFAFQISLNAPFVKRSCFENQGKPLIVPARAFLSQLV